MAKQQNDLLRALKQAEPVKGAVKVDLNAIYRAQQQAKTPYLASEAAAIPSEELELKTEELLTPEFSEQIKSKTEAFREQFAEELATGAAAKYREESDAQPAEEMASVPLSELAMISGSILNMTKDVPGETNAFGYDATARLRKKERVLDELKKNYGKYGFSFDLTPMGNYVARSSGGNIEVDLYGDGAQAADKLKGFIAKNAKKTQYQNEEFVDLSLKARETRPAARINPDGTRSTHLFTTMEVDGKHYAVPTLYQKTPNSQSSDPNDWVEYKSPDEAFKEAVRRGELYQFDTKGQAESFAKGSWKSINQGDLTRKRVAEQNGIEYGVMKQNELERKYSREEINSLEDAIDILSSNRPGLEPQKARLAAKMKKAYGVGTVDGLEKVLDEKRKQKDSIEDYFQSLSSIRQEADRQLEAERKKAEQQAIALNREVKTIQGNLNQKFNDYFGVPFLTEEGTINPEIKNVKPSDAASARVFNESIDAYNLLAQRQKQAAQVYLKERTYFDAKYDKEAQDKYVGEWQGLWNSIRSGWNEGKMSNVVLDAQAAKIAGDEEKLAIYNEQMFKMMNDPAISTAMSVGQERIAEATESGEFGDYLRALGANPSTFISGVANMSLNSIARMFPILWKTGSVIIPVSTAIGGAVGGVAGARAGFSTGMKIANAASGFSLEYTASVLESIRKKYNTLEKAQEGEWLNDPEVWEEARNIGVKRGLTIAAVDAITAGMLSKIAPSSLASTARRTTQAVGQALAIEPVSEAFGEAAAQFVSGQELNSVEILGEALGAGGMSSNPLTLADVVYQQTRKDYYTNLAEKMANSRSFLNDMDEDLGKVTQWTNNMRTTGQITGVTEQQILENVSVVREARQMMSATAPTNAQRVSQLALGTSSRAESRLADLIAAKRQLDRTPTINQPMQQVVQDEMNYILQNKKVPEQRVDLAPIIGLTPKYYINGKASLREDVAALLDPAKGADDELKDLNISIEGDEELLDKYVTRMESIFDKEDYEDGKVMLAAEDINEIPAEFRPEAVFNEETGRHEVTVPADKVENKDIANIAVRPKSQLEAATAAMKDGKPVYAKDTKSGNVYLLEDQSKIDDAYSRGMSLLLGGPSTRGVQTPLPLPKIKTDKIKAIKDSLKSMRADIGTMNSFGAGMGKSVWNFAIDSAILAIEAGESVSAAVEKAADYIDSKVTDFKRSDFVAYMTGQLTEKEKEIVRQARSTDLPSGLKVVKGFYSTIERRLLTSTIEKQSATKWLQSGIFGGDEGEFTGARAFLQAKRPDEQVEKKELLDYIKKNRVKISVKKDKVKEYAYLTEAEEGKYQEIIIEWDDANFPSSFDFNSHYTDKTIAHIRYVIRKDKDGNNVLFIEEVQSDLAQHIRDEEKKAKKDPSYKPNVVSAPYISNTSVWVKLALKVALQEAIKKNVTKVAWTTGEQQNARADIATQIGRLTYRKTDDGYIISAYDKENRRDIISNEVYQEDELRRVVGDEVSNKIINGEGEKQVNGSIELSGLALKVKGSAMVAFYGSIDEGKTGTVEDVMYALVEEITGKKPEIKTAELTLAPFVGKATSANANVNLEEEIERIEKELDEAVQGVAPYLKAKYLSEAKEILTGKEMSIAHDKYFDGIEGAFKKYFKAGTDIEAMHDAVNDIHMLDRSKRFAILAIKQIKEEREQAERRADSSTSKQRSVDITPQIVEKVKSGIPAFNDEKLSIEQRAEKIRQKMFAMKQKVGESEKRKSIIGPERKAIETLARRLAWRIGMKIDDSNFIANPNERWKGKYDPRTHSIMINFAYVTKDTPFHEILGHPIIYALKNGSPESRELYENLVKELQDSPEGIATYNMVSELYPELTEDQKIEEALVTLLGQLASESFDKKSKLGMLLEKLWNFVSEYVRELLGKDVIKVGELKPTTTIQDLADIMGYGENLIALPGAEVGFRTPFGETYTSIEEVKQDMARAGAATTLEFPNEPAVGARIKRLILSYLSEENRSIAQGIMSSMKELLSEITAFNYYDSITGKTFEYKLTPIDVEVISVDPDDYEAYDEARKLAVKEGINILKDKEIAYIVRDNDGRIIGAAFTSYDNSSKEYSFDVVVDSQHRRKGLGRALVEEVMNVPYDIKEMDPSAKVVVDVVNPAMRRMLLQIGFKDIEKIGADRFLMRGPRLPRPKAIRVFDGELYWKVTDKESGQVNFDLSKKREKNFETSILSSLDGDARHLIIEYIRMLEKYYSREEQFATSKMIIDKWKSEYGIKYDPQEAYDRGYGFYHYIGTGMSGNGKDALPILQNIIRFLDLQESIGGEYSLSCLNKLAFLPIMSQGANPSMHFRGGIRIAVYPNSEDIIFAANDDVYSGAAGYEASSASPAFMMYRDTPLKVRGRIGISLLTYPEFTYFSAVKNTILESLIGPDGMGSIKEQKEMHGYNESGIKLKKGRFRIEYDESISPEVKKMIDYINKSHGISNDKIPQIKENVLYGIKPGSYVRLMIDPANQILSQGYEPALIKVTNVHKNADPKRIASLESELAEIAKNIESSLNKDALKSFQNAASLIKDEGFIDNFKKFLVSYPFDEGAASFLSEYINKKVSPIDFQNLIGDYNSVVEQIEDIKTNRVMFDGVIMNNDYSNVIVETKSGRQEYNNVKKNKIFVYGISDEFVDKGDLINYQYAQGKKAKFPRESEKLKNQPYDDDILNNKKALEKNKKKALTQTLKFVEALAQANREFPLALLETSVSFAGFQPNEDTDVRFSRVPENDQTLYGAINDARNEGLTDGEIKRRMQQEGYSSSDINEAMTISVGDKEKLPRAFTMVEGGAFAGYSMYTNVQQKIRRFAKKEVNGEKPSSAKIREFAMQELSKHPLFLSSSDYLQMSLMADLDATLNTTANTAIQAQMKRIREAMRNINKGARELNEIRRQLTILIKSSLPRTMYAKAEVMALLKKVSSANRENIAEIRREVADFVIGVRVRATRAKLLKQLAAETTKKEGGRVKGNFSTAMQERIAKIKGMLPDEKASVEEIQKAIVALNSEYTRLNELVIDEGKDEYAEDLADVEFALKFAATMLMDDIEENKLIALDELYSYMKDFLKTGRAAFKDELKAQSEYYNKLKRQLLKDITGGDYSVNFSDKKAVDKVERALMGESVQKEKQRSFGKALRSFVDDTIGALLRRTEDLAGLVDRISNMTAEFFGGVSKKLIVDRVRESRANLNRLNNDAMAYLQTNAEQIFGKGWKKIMIQNGKKKFTYIMDPKGYQKVLKTGDKVAMQAFLLQNEAPISQNEMYYLYNQFKDPANHPGFETKFGPQYKEIMAEITSKLDPKVKEWADWQVEEFYPNMYPIYNEVYRRVYRTDLPWNQFYAGRLYRESADGQEAPSLLEKPSEFITAVGGASTKERVRNNKAVKTMDGDKVLTSYVRDMNFFASYAESIRDIKKMLNNSTIRKAIETRVGKDIYKLLSIMTDRLITDGFGKGKENDILDAGFKNFVYAKLGLNPKIMLGQASSFVGFIPFIGYGSYAKYATRAFSDLRKGKESTAYKTWAEMMENSEYLKARFSNSNIMEIMSTFSDSKRDVVLGGDKGLSIDNYANVMMYFIKQGDKAGVMGSVPNYLFYKEQYINKQKAAKKKVSEQDAIKYALKKIEAQVKSVAQSNDVEDKDFFQTGATAWRMFGVFRSQPKQYFRLEMYAIRNIYKHLMGLRGAKGTMRENIRLFVTVHLVAPVLFQYLMLGLPGILTDFDDDDDEELIWAGVLGNLNAIFIAGDVLEKIRDIALSKPWAADTTSISAFTVIADLAKEGKAIFDAKTDETRNKHIVQFSLLLSELSGIPAATLFKLSQNWYKVATGDVDNFGEAMLRLFNYSEYTIKGAPKKQKKAEDFTFEEDFKFEE